MIVGVGIAIEIGIETIHKEFDSDPLRPEVGRSATICFIDKFRALKDSRHSRQRAGGA
jgi:hypothetical protein